MSQNSFYEAAVAILNALGAPRTAETVNGLVAWMVKEKGWWYNGGDAWQWNNPLNTTLACCNWVGNANYVGVKIYPTREDGVEATIKTMSRGYPKITAALKAGDINAFLAAGDDFCYWVSGQRVSDCQYHQDIIWIYRHLPPPPDWAIGGGAGGEGETYIPGEERIPSIVYILVPLTALITGVSGAGLLVLWHKGVSISDVKDVLLRRIRHGR